MAKDWGDEASLTVFADSSAALGVVRRKGAGRLRHVRVGMLWIQDAREERQVNFEKVAGKENPADLLTKFNPAPTLEEHCRRMGMFKTEGRAELASNVSRGVLS